MHRVFILFLLFLMAGGGVSCSWIDDINTIEKKGSYEFISSSVEDENAQGSAEITNDSIECINYYDHDRFDVFDAQGFDGAIWQIIMYNQVRDKMDSTMLGIDFKPWAPDDPSTTCATPHEIEGSDVELTLDGCYHATLYVGRCEPRQTFVITGTLSLNEFSVERRESVKGSIRGKLNLVRYVNVEDRSTRSVFELGDFQASFQFPVHVGKVWMR